MSTSPALLAILDEHRCLTFDLEAERMDLADLQFEQSKRVIAGGSLSDDDERAIGAARDRVARAEERHEALPRPRASPTHKSG